MPDDVEPARVDTTGDVAAASNVGIISCVVDRHPRFHLEALRWFACLTTVAGVDPRDLVVNVVGPDTSDALEYLRRHGVTVRPVVGFDPRSPHCNKIAGALSLAEMGVTGLAVLSDSDVAILEDPRTLDIPDGSIGGKVVDTPVPPLEVIQQVFATAEVPVPATTPLPWGKDQFTVAGNSNGGLYLIPGPLLPRLARAWEQWARWLLDRRELLRDWTFHLDQVAMALALAAEGIPTEKLSVRWNTPIHDLSRIPPDPESPAVIHYHQEVDSLGRLRMTGAPSIDLQIERANAANDQLWLQSLPAETFWRWRALSDPQLGSETERGGEPRLTGREVLALLYAVEPRSVLVVDTGGGDVTQGLPIPVCSTVEPARLAESRPSADLTLCLGEALMRAADPVAYQELVAQLWQSADRALVLTGFESPRDAEMNGGHFHEPLATTLLRTAPDAELYPLRRAQGLATFVVLGRPETPHPRDVGIATLASVIDRHPDPLALLALRLESQRAFGFFPDHVPRVWEYPVAARLVMEDLPAGSTVVDVGAGITPVAPFLTAMGYAVDTVDPSDILRVWPPAQDWNEWGFLDYAGAGLAHRSWNCTLEQLPESPTYDGALSISVIEHIPATARRALLKDVAARVRAGGLMVLTVDLVRGSLELWNRNRGETVDRPGKHGTFADVISEGEAAGFELIRKDVVREWGDAEVDIGLIVMRRGAASTSWRRATRLLRRAGRAHD